MQSYKLHVVSENLKDRHPYVEPDFKDRYDPSEVYHAVFDRSIPKLIEILLMENIEAFKYRDALITLNEMVDHQEMKDQMISQGVVGIASAYLHHKDIQIRKQAVILLGCLVSIMRGREQLCDLSFDGLSKLLFDDAREQCGWALCRIITGRDGVDILCKSNLTKKMIQSFMQSKEYPKFTVYLLEAFAKIVEFDNGIYFFLNCGTIKRLIEILSQENYYDQKYTQRITYLSLEVLSKICANHEGKEEAINENAINIANRYLDSPLQEEAYFATILIMNCTINLEGKKQCVHVENDEIIQKLISLLNKDFCKDVKQALINIADYPEGFIIITKLLSNNYETLDDLLGPRVVIALAKLIPRGLENYDNYKQYGRTLCKFLRDYNDAIFIALEETVKIVEILMEFFYYTDLVRDVTDSLLKLIEVDIESREYALNYLETHNANSKEIQNISKKILELFPH
ncbi:unnamed protein product [Paramecium pentaurelia]|uniref:Uncharacterized protein n=1 Tax=Paramecium pentaurelia TaxID=43138 RepID=A0A8S1V5S9_9CILI|nr:unnamed protein product [Paramecium pentaurelia]